MANYNLYDASGNEVCQHDLLDKNHWCKLGLNKENTFLKLYGRRLGLMFNKNKKNDPYSLDFYNYKLELPADLKTQNTPFFSSKKKFGIDPQYAVTFNRKDAISYFQKDYEDILIYFWIDWKAVKMTFGSYSVEVKPMQGVYGIRFSNIVKMISGKNLHEYEQRKGTSNNGKESFVLDLQHEKFAKLF